MSTSPAWAQTIGVATLSGKVVDAQSGAPVPDAVVSVTSPALQGEQTVVSDGSGFYRIPNLPPGDYTLSVQADAHKPSTRGGIALRANVTVRLDVPVLPEVMVGDVVEVEGRPPTVDVSTTTSGLSINSAAIERLPLAAPGGRSGANLSFDALAEVVPTGRTDTYGGSFAGTTSPENGYIVDGLSVTDPAVGILGTPMSLEFVKEANVVTAGYLPEYGRTQGGVFDIVSKSGSNEFHGSLYGQWTPGSAAPKVVSSQNALAAQTRLLSTETAGFTLGGPLVKDKLWFFAGAQFSSAQYEWTRRLYAFQTNPDGTAALDSERRRIGAEVADARRSLRARGLQYQAFGKLDYRLDPDNMLTFSVKAVTSRAGGDGYMDVDPQTGAPGGGITGNSRPFRLTRYFPGQVYDLTLKWSNSSMNKRLLFDTTVGWHHEANGGAGGLAGDKTDPGTLSGLNADPSTVYGRVTPSRPRVSDFETLPNPGICADTTADGTVVRCPVNTYGVGGPGQTEKVSTNRVQAREVITYLFEALGHHVIKLGAEAEYAEVARKTGFSGLTSVREAQDGSTWDTNGANYSLQTRPDQLALYQGWDLTVRQVAFGAFVQDSWSIMDRVTLNAGLRYDSQTLYTAQGDVAIALPNQVAPRLGLIWDPTQSGKAKVFANYALYYQSLPLRISSRGISGEPSNTWSVPTATCDPSNPNFRGCVTDPNNAINANGPYDPSRKYGYFGFGRAAVDPDLKPGSSTEISAGGEYEVVAGGRLGLTYIHRQTNSIIEDMSRDEAATYFIGNPGEGIAKDFPKAERIYDAGVIQFTKAFRDDWLAQASYTLSYLRGNWEGFFRSQTGQLDPGANSDFDLLTLLQNRKGPLGADSRHEFKLYGAKDWQLDEGLRLTTGVSYRARSGAPTNFVGRHIIYQQEVFLLPRGEGERLPWVHNFDLHFALGLWKTKSQSVSLTTDIFNLFNFQAATLVDNNYTTALANSITDPAALNSPYVPGREKKEIRPEIIPTPTGAPFRETQRNPNFGTPTQFQDPLTIRIGIRTTF
ncbi:MAG TPA: TonB-dependent receptor [Polyangiaceae bacterium]|nr:TonB-dependent receptor [Polyangiaceae bacterium]